MEAKNIVYPIATFILGIIAGVFFISYDINFNMDDNTRIAIESLNETVSNAYNLVCFEQLIECKDQVYELGYDQEVYEFNDSNCYGSNGLVFCK